MNTKSIFRENQRLYAIMTELYDCLSGMRRFQEAQQAINAFLAEEEPRGHYEELLDLEEELHRRQQEGEITEEDLEQYRRINEKLQKHPNSEEFFSAQSELEDIHAQIVHFIGLAIETGQVPSADEFDNIDLTRCGCCADKGGGGK